MRALLAALLIAQAACWGVFAWLVMPPATHAQAPRLSHQACVARGMVWDLPTTNANPARTPLTDLAGTRIYVVAPDAARPATPVRMLPAVPAPSAGATGGPWNCQEGLPGDYDAIFTAVDTVGNESAELRVPVDNSIPSNPTNVRLGTAP